jgi:hypothetical protein
LEIFSQVRRKLIWHIGNYANARFASIFDRFPEEERTVVAMTNNTGLIDYKATLLIEGQEQPSRPMQRERCRRG